LANLGFNPMNNGDSVIINVPPLTEERRRELSKQAKAEAEDAKIGIRNDRKNANQEIKKLDISEDVMKMGETEIQRLTDTYIEKVDKILQVKEKEIMTV
ncbi:MAG TPA: ribosome-recycling factor, partial [Salinimicrobium sp.]|nr:ribosome-recycling factor [Salinimicrobium sp.]